MDKFKQQINDILAMIEKDEIKKKILDFFNKDVKIYLQKIIKLEQKIEINRVVSSEIKKEYFADINKILQKAEELEKVVNQRLIMQKIKNAFRIFLINSPVYKSLMVKRAFEKPRGYPGDYQMIELFYDNKPISKEIGFYGDKYILNDNYVRAVRKRKDCMKKILANFIKNSKLSSINILNVGCGSNREIRELFLSNFITNKKLHFTLIDQDEDALLFSRNTFKYLSKYISKNIKEYRALAPDWFCGWSFFPRDRRNLIDIVKTYIGKNNYDIKFSEEKLK